MTKQNNFLMLTTACIASLLVANADIHCSNHTKSSYDEGNHSISQIPSDHQTQLTGVNGTKREEKGAGGSKPKNLCDQIQQICDKKLLNDEDKLSLEKLKQQYNGNINTLCKIIHSIKYCEPELQLEILKNIDLTSLTYDCIDDVMDLTLCITNLVKLAPDVYNYIMRCISGTSDEHYAVPHILRDFDRLSSFIEGMRDIWIVEAQQRAIDALAFVYTPTNLITTIQELEEIIGHISHTYPTLQRRFIDNLKLADVVRCIGSGVNNLCVNNLGVHNLSSVLSAINELGYKLTTKTIKYINGEEIIEYGLKEGQSELNCCVKNDLENIKKLDHEVYVANLEKFDYNSREVYETLHNFDTNLKQEFIEKLNLADLARQCINNASNIVDTLKVIGVFEKRLQPLLIDKLDLAQITKKHINDFLELSAFLDLLKKLDGELPLTAIEKLKLADLTACCIKGLCNDNNSGTYRTLMRGRGMQGIKSVIEWVATLDKSLQLKAIELLDLADITAKYVGDVSDLQSTIKSIGQCDRTLGPKILDRLNIIELGCKYIYEEGDKQIFIKSVGDTIPDSLKQTKNIINFSDVFARNPEYLKKFLLNTQNHDNQQLLKDIQTLKRTYVAEKYINVYKKSIESFFSCMRDVNAYTQQLIIDELNIAATVSKCIINRGARGMIDFVTGLEYLYTAQQLQLLENLQINKNITFRAKNFLLNIIKLTIPLCEKSRHKILGLPNIEIELNEVRTNCLYYGLPACVKKDCAIVLLQRKMYKRLTPKILVDIMKESPMNMVGRVMRYWTHEKSMERGISNTDKRNIQTKLSQWYDAKSTETTEMYKILRKIPWIYEMDNRYMLNDLSPNNIREIFTAIGSIQSGDTRKEYYRAIVGYLTNEHDHNFITPGFRNFMLQAMHDNDVTLRNLLDMIDGNEIDKKIEKLDLSNCMSLQKFYGIAALAEVYCETDAQRILDEHSTKEGTEFENLDDVILDDVSDDESITPELLKILTKKYNEEIGG